MAKFVPESEKKALNERLDTLLTADRAQLVRYWEKIYQKPPPPNISSQLMRYAIAYKWQEKLYGGLKPATKRYLLAIAEQHRAGGNGKQLRRPLDIKPGTRLLREWNGITHEVIVADKGMLYRGKEYRSLSVIAREITGVRWSGPLFFGLRRGQGA